MVRTLLLLFIATIAAACSNGSGTSKESAARSPQEGMTEVLYFHGKQRCITCNAIEQLTKEVIDSLADKKVTLKIIDLSKKENEAIADNYEVTWSSLIIDGNGEAEELTEMAFRYAKSEPTQFKARLSEAIRHRTASSITSSGTTDANPGHHGVDTTAVAE